MTRRYAAAALAGLLAVALCSGCTSHEREALPLPEKNTDKWTMPLDPYGVGDATVTDYAEGLLVKPCMEASGFAYDVPWIDINAAPTGTGSVTGEHLFSESIASEWGYHVPPSNQPNAAQLGELSSAPLTSDAQARLSSCLDEARKTVPAPDGVDQIATSLSSAARDAAMADVTVLSAAEKWRECMAPQGISDLPALPLEMPSPSLAERFGLSSADLSSSPSAEEIAVATADAACQESSGFRQTLYDTEWDKQVVALRDNADALVRAKEKNDKRRAAALQVINAAGAS